MPDIIAGTNPRVQYRGTDGAWHDLPVGRVELTYTHDAPIPLQPRFGDVSLSFTVNTDGARTFNALIRRLRRLHARSPQKHICSVLTSRLRSQFPRLKPAQIDRLARVIRRKQGRPMTRMPWGRVRNWVRGAK